MSQEPETLAEQKTTLHASTGTQAPCVLEAHRIYASLLGRPAPPIIIQRFAAASQQLDATVSPEELDAYRRIVSSCGDLEALELAARYAGRLSAGDRASLLLLSRKFRLMVYLAETLPENQHIFVNERSSLVVGLYHCFAGAAWTALKGLKGLWLLRRVRDKKRRVREEARHA